jgi:hypothetical protein
MADKHDNMPGMSEPPKKSTQGQAPEKPQQAGKSKPAEAPAHPDKAKHQPKAGET